MDERIYTEVLTGTLVDRVAGILTRYNMLSSGDRVGVGVSGGADSVALLYILHKLSHQFGFQVAFVLHVNHHLRGMESDRDEEFVRSVANSLGIEVLVDESRVEGNIEQSARIARRDFFRKCREKHDLSKVALGHTRSDQAETVLFRFLRGSGLTGLAGMQMVSVQGLIRPLLTTSRAEVREWAKAEGIEWREDASNLDPRFARNRLRNRTIPELEQEYNPNLEGVLAGMARLAQAEEEYWNQQIEPIYQEITKRTRLGSIFQIAFLNALHPAVQRRLIRRALVEIRGNLRGIDLEHVEGILRICGSAHGHDRVLVPGADALRSYGQLLLTWPGRFNARERNYRLNLVPGEELQLPAGSGTISINWVNREAPVCANFKEEARQSVSEAADLDGEVLFGQREPGLLVVRNWEPGDELHRPGHRGAEKIKSLFQEYQVLLWERRHWPVVVSDGEIVWTRQFGGALKFRGSEQARRIVRLTYQASR